MGSPNRGYVPALPGGRESDNMADSLEAMSVERQRHIDLVTFWWKRAKGFQIALTEIARTKPDGDKTDLLVEVARVALVAEGVEVK